MYISCGYDRHSAVYTGQLKLYIVDKRRRLYDDKHHPRVQLIDRVHSQKRSI